MKPQQHNTLSSIFLLVFLISCSDSLEVQNAARSATSGRGPCPGGGAPAYWVAPMDANYRRDEPGKSPMGMDLIPYCEETDDDAAGIRINPQLVQNMGVRTAPVEHATLNDAVRAVGVVSWNEETLLHIHSRAEGWVEELSVVAVGDTVRGGQALYALYSPKLFAAESEYLAARSSSLQDASARRLRGLGYTETQIREVKKRGKASDRMVTTAPADLTVVELGVRKGQFVTPGTKTLLLADPRRVWLTVQVPERYANAVRVGQQARARVAAVPGRAWSGTVEQIYPELDPVTRTVKLRLAFANLDGTLMPQMYASVDIATPQSIAQLLVPSSAVIRTGHGARVVRALGDGRFDVRTVRIGHSAGGQTAILEGLELGDEVVISGQFLLDSEANIDAEAQRMSALEEPVRKARAGMAEGVVVDLDKASRNILLQHGDFSPMGDDGMTMPAMTMPFLVDEPVDLSAVQPGDRVHVVVEDRGAGVYAVTQIHNMTHSGHAAGASMDSMSSMGQQEHPSDHDAMGMPSHNPQHGQTP